MADTYKVVKGDTLNKIAAANGVTLAQLLKWNPQYEANPNLIHVGDTIRLAPAGDSDTDDSTSSGTAKGGQTLNNVPGTPEVWKVGNTTYLVYTVPGTEADPVYMAWEVSNKEDLQSMFGPDQPILYNRTMSQSQFAAEGVLEFGDADELANTSDDPFLTWEQDMETLSLSQPWILDADYQALVAMAILEGRAITDAEIKTTDWWRTHNAAQREWMSLVNGDPEQANQVLADRRLLVADMIKAAGGGTDVDSQIIDYMATQWASGNWTQVQLSLQIKGVTDPYANVVLDEGLSSLIDSLEGGGIGSTVAAEDTVRSLLNTWLGPMFGDWSDDEIARIAGDIRNDPEAQQKFVEQLKDQRMAVLGEYDDRELSYQAIANTWKQWWMGQWGEMPDEKQDLWLQVLKNNNTTESAKLLRREGLATGVRKVVNDANAFAYQGSDALIRRAV